MNFNAAFRNQINWLLEGDPAVRYQTLRDLTGAGESVVEAERARIQTGGWGRRFLDLQDREGTWAHALYSQKWISTFYTLLLLYRMGIPPLPETQKACRILLDRGFYEPDGGINYWKSWKQGECCVTGMLLTMGSYFLRDNPEAAGRLNRMITYIFNQQMPDGGWNCEKYRGAHHSSFHTTISVLEGLWEYTKQFPQSTLIPSIRRYREQGTELLLQHHLYKSDTTWQPVHPDMTKLSFPPRWRYDILRCLDHFQESSVPCDTRMDDALTLLEDSRTRDGFWKTGKRYPGKLFFTMEPGRGPSRWITLRALRVIRKYKFTE